MRVRYWRNGNLVIRDDVAFIELKAPENLEGDIGYVTLWTNDTSERGTPVKVQAEDCTEYDQDVFFELKLEIGDGTTLIDLTNFQPDTLYD